MTRSEKGSVDGIRVAIFEAGKEYDLTHTAGERALAAAFVGASMAVDISQIMKSSDLIKPITMTLSQSDAREAAEKNPFGKRKGKK